MRLRVAAALIAAGLVACNEAPRADRSRAAQPGRSAAAGAAPLVALGDSLYREEAYDSARAVWKLALARAEASRDVSTAANLLTSLALTSWKLGELADARRLVESAISRGTQARTGFDASRAYNSLGLIALGQDHNIEAASLFERAGLEARRAGDARALARAAGNLGLAYTYLGQFDRAREGHRTLREAGRRLQDARYEANGLANEAMVDLWEGDAAPGVARLDTARALYRRIGYESGEQNALGQLATAFELTGEYGRAFAALDTALALASRKRLKPQIAEAMVLIAGLHMRVGDYRRAVRAYAEADSLMRDADAGADRAAALRGKAEALLRLGSLASALRDASTALRLDKEGGEPLATIDDELLLARIAARSGDGAASAAHLGAAQTLAQRAGTRGSRLAVALTQARLADASGGSARVLAALRQLARDQVPDDFEAAWEADALAARAHARMGALDSAAAAGRRSISAIEHLRSRLSSEPLRATLAVERSDVYGDLALVLLRQGRSAEAFSVADAARSRSLIEHLEQARGDRAVYAGAAARGEALLRQIDALVLRLKETRSSVPAQRGTLPDTGAAALEARLAAARAAYESAAIQAAEAHPATAAVLGVARPRLDAVQRALLPGEVLLEYLLAGDSLLVFVVSPGDLRVIRESLDRVALVQRSRLVREVWASAGSDWPAALPAARALYRTLVRPVESTGALSRARRLFLVPHGVVAQVPFAALPDGSGRFLVEKYALAELPLAAALPVVRAAHGDRGGRASVLAPFPAALPATAREARAVRAAIPAVDVLAGATASEPALRRALTGTGVVHIASHGVLNARSPMFSRLELARPRPGRAGDDDGRLELHEILGLKVRSQLVFLSGCETGAGIEWQDDAVRGTGDLTLAQAFLAAGARNVVSTLWRIDDDGAAAFAARFYLHLRTVGAADALASAQRALAADGRFRSPYYWAGYRLVGDGRVRDAQDGPVASVR